MRFIPRLLAGALLAMLLALTTGCATGPNANPADPLEPFNRGVTQFNDGVDRAVIKPVATAYDTVAPRFVRTGVSNFFNNLGDAWSAVNAVLQLKPQAAVDNFFRFQINTVFGLGGLLDFASEANIERHKEDFGQTLGRWGVPSGPYLVLPILGPSTVRDTAALPVDSWGSAISHINDVPVRNYIYGLRAIDARANLLRTTNVIDQAALDKYSFTRDAYLQLRRNDVYDGNPPEERAPTPAPAAPAK
jgi:phospholipid-binding lipoprotein MlaA